jgi:protein-S-isoprenylcysteine O-methyltransferase Ste14
MVVIYAALFVSAGTLWFPSALWYAGIGLLMTVAQYTVFKMDPALLEERAQAKENTQQWDKNILLLLGIMTITMCVVAGLDSGRFHWSPAVSQQIQMIGGVLTILGQLVFIIAQKQNVFFSSTVRIQHNRGHEVCDTGLYSVVRHPGYMGMLMQSIGFPLLFGSLWSVIPVAVSVVLIVVRTYKEDTFLTRELRGYAAYIETVQYRLLPYVW